VVFGAVGHFRKEKGVDNILHAYSHFLANNKNQNTTLVIVGTGSDEQINYLHTLAQNLSVYRNIIFAGHDNDVAKWYSLFDVYLHAARKEAFGLVLIEAMAAGLPVIASKVGGIPDIVLHNKTGFLADPGNHTEFSKFISKLTFDKQMRCTFGKCAKEIALKKYSTTEYANSYVAIYKSLKQTYA
jgi:glycosyltransferase involved in cell wall biosynthesis